MKVRGGNDTYVKHDGSIGTAGKGALVGDECAYTVAVTQDQTLVMASGQANAEITSDGSVPTITCLKDKPIVFDRAAISQGANAKFAPSITRSEIASTITTDGGGGVAFRVMAQTSSERYARETTRDSEANTSKKGRLSHAE